MSATISTKEVIIRKIALKFRGMKEEEILISKRICGCCYSVWQL